MLSALFDTAAVACWVAAFFAGAPLWFPLLGLAVMLFISGNAFYVDERRQSETPGASELRRVNELAREAMRAPNYRPEL